MSHHVTDHYEAKTLPNCLVIAASIQVYEPAIPTFELDFLDSRAFRFRVTLKFKANCNPDE